MDGHATNLKRDLVERSPGSFCFLLGRNADVPPAAEALGTEHVEHRCGHAGLPGINFDGVTTKLPDIIERFDCEELFGNRG